MEKCYSCDEEMFEDNENDIVERIWDEGSVKVGEIVTIFEGDKKPQTIENFFDVESILENISESAGEECGECAEDYLSAVTEEQRNDLGKRIDEWATKHNLQPRFWMVENVKEIKIRFTEANQSGFKYERVQDGS